MISRPTFYLRLQTRRDGIDKPRGRLCRAILIINLYELYFGELFEVLGQQICDCIGCPCAVAGPFKVDVRDAIDQFKTTVVSKTVVKSDPAVREAFCRAGAFEVFIQKALIHIVAANIADSRSFKGRQIILITELAHKVNID